jgi:hypothetical protein
MVPRRAVVFGWCGCGGAPTDGRGRPPFCRYEESGRKTLGAKTRRIDGIIVRLSVVERDPATGFGAPTISMT